VNRRRAFSLTEIVVVSGIGLALLVPLITLASRSVAASREIVARRLAEELCISLVERLEGYKAWLPVVTPNESSYPPMPTWALHTPLDGRPGERSFPDEVYRQQLARLELTLTPSVERVKTERLGLVRLTVRVEYEMPQRNGSVEIVRYCHAP
jgi:type II secretory pathway pseudopilin PulG